MVYEEIDVSHFLVNRIKKYGGLVRVVGKGHKPSERWEGSAEPQGKIAEGNCTITLRQKARTTYKGVWRNLSYTGLFTYVDQALTFNHPHV